MKRTLVFLAVACTCLGAAQTKMRVILAGKPAGTASLTQKLREDGSKQVLLSMDLVAGEAKISLRSESIYSANGMPVRKFQETIAPAQKFRRSRVVTFDSKGATVVEDVNGTRSTKKVPLDAKANRANMSEFWFLREKPKPGTEETCYNFNLDTMAWELVTSTYEGVVEITIGTKKVKAHRVKTDRGVAFSALDGSPLRLELANGAIERVW